MPKTSLTTRAFLFSFLPVCVVLAASFLALNTLVQQRVKEGMRDSVQKSEQFWRGPKKTTRGASASSSRCSPTVPA